MVKYTVEIHIIFGPTASSKTKMAQALWETNHYPILSVDSRKVYKGADIGTNKLSLLEFKRKHPEVLVGGIDFKLPSEEINVYEFQQQVYGWIDEYKEKITKLGGLIIHGGTGLYLDSILEGKSFLSQRNGELREALANETVERLQEVAARENVQAYEKLNESDRQNPRRLIRVIENKNLPPEPVDSRSQFFSNSSITWHIKLPERPQLYTTINERVYRYFVEGWLDEIASLRSEFGDTAPALQMMGYKQLVAFQNEYQNWLELYKENAPEFQKVVALIQHEHRRYAKRQETWAKKYIRRQEGI